MKKRLGILGFASVAALALNAFVASADPVRLQDFRWQNRLIVDCDLRSERADAPSEDGFSNILKDDEDNVRRLALLRLSLESGFIFFAHDKGQEPIRFDQEERDRIVTLIQCDAGDRVIGLIGLDGGVKQIWRDEVPSSEDVFALIDAMPMRVQELQAERAKELTE